MSAVALKRALDRISVAVQATDPVSQVGVVSQLRTCHDVELTSSAERAAVSLIVVDAVDSSVLRSLRGLSRRAGSRRLVVAARLDAPTALAALEAGASGLLRRAEATRPRVVEAIRAVAGGEGVLPPDLVGGVLERAGRPVGARTPRGLTYGGLTRRELEVLQLLAEGYSTGEIASRLAYSERTIKNAIHDVTSRLQLRNRSHAVAFAVRAGLI
jgi:DNA-binding NarL/FixJ family response regulator